MSVYLTVHFTAVVLYSTPGNYFEKVKHYVFPYMYPYFHQSWSLFVPVPQENFNVYVKTEGEKWEDVFQKIISEHQNNRLAGNEALMLSFSNGLRYYASDVNETSAIMNDDGSNLNFEVIKKMTQQLYIVKSEKKAEEIIIVCKNITGSPYYAHYYKLRN